jgi:NTE family protein
MKHLTFLIAILFTIGTLPLKADTHQPRKKVGLVLSGGGAKGMAHIGAIKIIEEAGIPIDYVVGTSMGSIIGGLYSIGYTPEQMDSMVHKQDWGFLLSDQILRKDMNMQEREADEKYVISVPFNKSAIQDLTGGLIKGQNISNLFSELTLGYHDSLDFNKLPIPFACVSENIVKGEEYVFHDGVLSTAMRASMAIPGVFTPVRLDSMVLVDGGVVNNYPVNVAKQMGADVIIGVDVQSELRPANELENAGAILSQLIDLMGQDNYLKNLKETDVLIKVNVKGYSAASFTKNAVDSLIHRGIVAAKAQQEALMELKKEIGLPADYRPIRKHTYQPVEWIMIKDIHFKGLDEEDTEWVMNRCGLEENTFNSIERIEGATSIILANTSYSNISYNLLQNNDGTYDLNYTLNKKNESRINIGVRFDSEEIASLLINARTMLKSKLPAYISASIRLGKRYGAELTYGIDTSPLSSLGLSYQYMYSDIDYHQNGKPSFATTTEHHKAEISYYNVWLRNFRFGVGAKYELYDYGRFLHMIGNQGFEVDKEHFFSYFANLHYETYDNAYFPSKGVKFHSSYSLNTDNFLKYKDETPFSIVSGSFEGVVPITSRFAILPSIRGRMIFGTNIPFSKMNVMGGDAMEQYLPDQLPFSGTNQVQLMDNTLIIGGMKFRQRIGGSHYLTLAGNYALSSGKIKNILREESMLGCSIGYGMDSMFGPLEASLNYTNRSKDVGFYINLGYKF